MVKYMKYGTQMENVYVEDVKVSQEVKLTFLLLSLGRYLCWWTINPRWYNPSSS
jgi:hypothetical protein